MSNITRLPIKLTPDTLDQLLHEASTVHTFIHRLQAEALKQYGPNNPTFFYVDGYLSEFESYIDHSTRFFERLEDEKETTSIVGSLSISEMKRRRARLDQRIEEAENKGNIVSFASYKARKTFQPVEPPEAA